MFFGKFKIQKISNYYIFLSKDSKNIFETFKIYGVVLRVFILRYLNN